MVVSKSIYQTDFRDHLNQYEKYTPINIYNQYPINISNEYPINNQPIPNQYPNIFFGSSIGTLFGSGVNLQSWTCP